MTVGELKIFLEGLPNHFKINVWLTNDLRDPGGTYNIINVHYDQPRSAVILYVEGEDE